MPDVTIEQAVELVVAYIESDWHMPRERVGVKFGEECGQVVGGGERPAIVYVEGVYGWTDHASLKPELLQAMPGWFMDSVNGWCIGIYRNESITLPSV